jgi:protein TonB
MDHLTKTIKLIIVLLIVIVLHMLVLWQVVEYIPQKTIIQPHKLMRVRLIPTSIEKSPHQTLKSQFKKINQSKKNITKQSKAQQVKFKKVRKIAKKPKTQKKRSIKKVVKQVNSQISHSKKKAIKSAINAISSKDVIVQSAEKPTHQTPSSKISRNHQWQHNTKKSVITAPSYQATYLHNPYPPYPPMSRRRSEEGTVLLQVKVTKNGDTALVRIKKSSGSSRLDNVAHKTVSAWRFVPAKKNGKPVNGWVIVPITFNLR